MKAQPMTAVLVASSGGHLAQLVEIETRVAGLDGDRLWITFDSPQSRSLLEGRKAEFIPPIEERDVAGVGRGMICAHRLLRRMNVTAMISTGSAIALSFLPYAAIRRIEAHYIESAARVDSPSLTGRLLSIVPAINLYRQYPHASGARWKYAGSVFDGFECVAASARKLRRVVVTLGSGIHGFRRLLDRLVAILPPDVEVLWQTGSTPVDGLAIDARPLVPAAELDRAIADADAVVAHAGCGSALSALSAGKFPVLVPREPKYGELVDNHQIELTRWLVARNIALHRTPETLELDDILLAAALRVVRVANPPVFRLS
jgi:UDP-N-acetylglucosamine--N-acetylmuramyl-(pentapeptide) pyrophosphoryl-undecaprenol N-acetylglucosamine transferase